METDHVDEILAQWARERPDLDASPIGLIGRLHRLADVLNPARAGGCKRGPVSVV